MGMTREEAWNRIDAIIARHEIDDDYVTITSMLDYDALRMARKALEQQPCEDAINRQTVLDCLYATKLKKFDFILHAREEIKKLPPVKPQEPKTGHWINESSKIPKCSECGIYSEDADRGYDSFCPNCGCRMVDSKESEE